MFCFCIVYFNFTVDARLFSIGNFSKAPALSRGTLAVILTMDKNTNRRHLIKLTILICLLLNGLTHAQDTTNYQSKILGRWVIYREFEEDSMVYVHFNSELTANLELDVKYAGITFEKDNVCLHHRWMKCGNDSGPDYYKDKWTLQKLNNKFILSISKKDGQTKNYLVLRVTDDKLILAPTP